MIILLRLGALDIGPTGRLKLILQQALRRDTHLNGPKEVSKVEGVIKTGLNG